MNSGIDLNFTINSDYSKLNPPQFSKILNLYNTILVPQILNNDIKVNIGDTITIIDHTTNKKYSQTVVIDCGFVDLAYKSYYFFHIANGLTLNSNNSYSVQIQNNTIPLSTNIDNSSSAKLIIGLLILSDNHKYKFNKKYDSILNINNINYKVSILDILNKFNYYIANKNTTIIKILDHKNYNILQQINNNITIDKYIRPLFNYNFPLGSINIDILGVSDPVEYQIYLNNKTHIVNSKKITIQNLESGQYSIRIIDKDGPVTINKLNNNYYNNNIFNFYIPEHQYLINNYSNNLLKKPFNDIKPIKGLCNLMINLSYNKPIEIIGPDNFYYSSDTDYFSLNNIKSGEYTIIQDNKSKKVNIHMNNTTYINGL